jgi:hypothetical protein
MSNEHEPLSARFQLDEFGTGCDTGDFQSFIDSVNQHDGIVEIRVAISPLNGVTEDGNGTQNIPEQEPLYCTRRSDGNWLVEFCDRQHILSAIVTSEALNERTRRRG